MRAKTFTKPSQRSFVDTKKIEAYLGFALRAGKLALGLNAIELLKKGVYCLLLDEDAAKNSHKQSRKLCARFRCPLVVVKDLGALTKREGCKVVALQDESLAGALLSEAKKQDIPIEGANG